MIHRFDAIPLASLVSGDIPTSPKIGPIKCVLCTLLVICHDFRGYQLHIQVQVGYNLFFCSALHLF